MTSEPQQPVSLFRRVASGTLQLSVAQYGSMAIGLIKMPILARLVAPEVFGVVALATAWTSFMQVFRLELREVVIADTEGHAARLNTQFIIELISSLPGILIALALYLAWPGLATTADWTAIFALLGMRVVHAATSTPLYILHRDIRQATITRLTLLGFALGFVVSVALAWQGYPLAALLADAILPPVTVGVGAWLTANWRLTLTWDPDVARDVYGFAFTLWTSALLQKIMFEADDWLVGRLDGKRSLGFYSRAYTTAKMPMDVFGGAIGGIGLSMYAHARTAGADFLNRAYAVATWLLTRIVAWSSIVFLAAADEIAAVLLGPNWLPVPLILRLLALYMLGRPLWQNNSQLLLAIRQEGSFRLTLVVQAAVLIVLGVPAIYFYGAEGAAVATSVMMLLGLVVSQRLAARYVDASLRELYGLPLVLVVVLVPLTYWLGTMLDAGVVVELLLKGGFITLAFAGAVFLLEPRQRDEVIRMLRTFLNRDE